MNNDNQGKVNDIKTDIGEIESYEDDYDDENLDLDENEIHVEQEDDDADEEDDKKVSNKSDLSKKLLRLMIIIIVGMIILLLLLYIVSKINGKSYTYESVEKVMQEAAESYFADNKSSLPETEEQTVEIDVANLVNAEKMKPLDDYLGKDCGCTGKVQVKKIGSDYVYTPYLNCGEKYSTKFLADTVGNDENLVGSGYGLYLQNGNYVFRGEDVKNYLKMEAHTWRIVRVNSDKTIVVTTNDLTEKSYPYDDRFNQQEDSDMGINNFSTSRVREQLNKMYNTTDESDRANYLLSLNDKTHVINYDICVGKISELETIHDNSKECSQTIQGYVGLLTVSDFMNASIDTGCNSVLSESCQNYNYLAGTSSYWLVTANNQNTSSAFIVYGDYIGKKTANATYRLRPVVTLDANTLISGGTGTEEDPYIVK